MSLLMFLCVELLDGYLKHVAA